MLSMRLGAAEVHLPPEARDSRADILAARSDLQAVLRETQQILRVLRLGDDRSEDAAPAPTIDGIPELVTGFRATGLQIEANLGDLTLPVGKSPSVRPAPPVAGSRPGRPAAP